MIMDGSPNIGTLHKDKAYVFTGAAPNTSFAMRMLRDGTGNNTKCRIKPLWNFSEGSAVLIRDWSKYFVGSNIELVDTEPDYFLVINWTKEPIDPARTIYFIMEPHGEKMYSQFLSQYGTSLKALIFKYFQSFWPPWLAR